MELDGGSASHVERSLDGHQRNHCIVLLNPILNIREDLRNIAQMDEIKNSGEILRAKG
jgi:hypothetical protein